jgi:hypothetical protein
MLPLSAEKIPATADEFTKALTRGLLAHGLTPRNVQVTGEAFPQIERLQIDLTDAHLARSLRPPSLAGKAGEPVTIAHFEITGEPLYFEKTPLTMRVQAQSVQARLVGGEEGGLVPEAAESGTLAIEIAHAALETLVHTLAVETAAKQGIEVRKTHLTFTQEGPRTVAFRAEVMAKIFVMSATISLDGRLAIDDALNARLSGLTLGGDAMITKLASGYVRPHLDRLEGRVFPLLAYTAGGLELHDLELVAGPTLAIRARIGRTT